MLTTGEQALALLPTRFRKLIWVKRGDYLITSTSAGEFETSAGEAGKVSVMRRYVVERRRKRRQLHSNKESQMRQMDVLQTVQTIDYSSTQYNRSMMVSYQKRYVISNR